jgi:recombination protein RecT
MCKKTVAKRHSKVLPMSTDLDDLLRRDDSDDGAGEPLKVRDQAHYNSLKEAPPRTLTDALNMIASLPEGSAPDQMPIDHDENGEVIEYPADAEAAKHEHH